jgi:UrcA family protein
MTKIKTPFSLRHIVAPALLIAAAAAAMPAGAADAPVSITVKYDDLNLSRPAGVNALYNRIQAAARTVCEPLSSQSHLQSPAYMGCFSDAVSDAVQKVGQPALSSLYQDKTGKALPARFASLETR